ncbi:MAG: hypothetical protein FWD44_02130 [Oscillospiraceae bacterium]|nr:hypothetical protein [Oscillospiraceae bacterium]
MKTKNNLLDYEEVEHVHSDEEFTEKANTPDPVLNDIMNIFAVPESDLKENSAQPIEDKDFQLRLEASKKEYKISSDEVKNKNNGLSKLTKKTDVPESQPQSQKNDELKSTENQSSSVSLADRIETANGYYEEYLEIIDCIRIVSWQLINKFSPAKRTTINSRLDKLVKDKKIQKFKCKKTNDTYYASNNYFNSSHNKHNLWVGLMSYNALLDGCEVIKGYEVKKDKNHKYRFSRVGKNDNFIPDIVTVKDGITVAHEVELNKKSGDALKNKIEAYAKSIRNGLFQLAFYYIDLSDQDGNSIKKKLEYWVKEFNAVDKIQIVNFTDEELGIK